MTAPPQPRRTCLAFAGERPGDAGARLCAARPPTDGAGEQRRQDIRRTTFLHPVTMRPLFIAFYASVVTAPLPAQVPINAATTLARHWASAADEPRCQPRGPLGESLGAADARYCIWPASGSSLSGVIFVRVGPSLVTWDRYATNAKDALRISDSLNTGLAKMGLVRRVCAPVNVPAGHGTGFQWKGDSLVVQLTRIDPPSGSPHLMIVATNSPRAVPPIICGGTSSRIHGHAHQ